MTEIDTIDLDNFQDLSMEEEGMLKQLGSMGAPSSRPSRTPSSEPNTKSAWYPLIIALTITFLVFIFNSDFIQSKLQEVPYHNLALLGILFSSIILIVLFL